MDQMLFCLQFRNKAREKQRQLTLKQRETSGSKPARMPAALVSGTQQPLQKKLPAAKRRRIETQEDDATLVEDYRHLKKLKNGQITQVFIKLFTTPSLLSSRAVVCVSYGVMWITCLMSAEHPDDG